MPSRPPPATLLVALLLAATVLTGAAAGTAAAIDRPAAAPVGPVAAAGGDAGSTTTPAATCGSGGTLTPDGDAENVSITTWTAPGSVWNDLRSGDALQQAIETGQLTPASAGADRYEDRVVATGDVVVHRIRLNGSATGLLDRLAAQDTGSPTTNLHALVQQDGVDLRYVGPTACPPELAWNATIANDSLRVVLAAGTDTLYLVVDVANLRFGPLGGGDDPAERYDWGHHAVTLVLQPESGLVTEKTIVGDHYEVSERHVSFASEHEGLLQVQAESNQTVRGTASMAPGTTLTLELVPFDAPNGTAVHTATATLDRNGSFSTAFDLSTAPASTLYRVRIPETPRDDAPYRLVAVGNATGASITVADQESIGTVLYATGVTTTHGGFVVARNDTHTVAVSDHFGPGAVTPQPDYDPLLWGNETLTVTVYHDTDGDQAFDPAVDEPYRMGGVPVQDTVNVTVDVAERKDDRSTTTTTATTTATTTTVGSPGTTTPPSTTGPPTTTSDSTQGTQSVPAPGFGPVVALVAMAAAALAARR